MFTHPWAILGLYFVGKSVIEIVCHEGLKDQIVAKLRLIGATHIKNMNIFGDNMKKVSQPDTRARETANLERAHKRFERLVVTCTNSAAKSWYVQQAGVAERRLTAIYGASHDVETSVSEDSGYDSNEVTRHQDSVPGAASSARMEVDPALDSDTEAFASPLDPIDVDTDTPVSDQAPDAPQEK